MHLGFTLSGVVARTESSITAFDIHLYLIFHSFDLHDLSFEGGVLFHVIAVDSVKFGIDGYFEVIDVMFYFSFHAIDRLSNF